MALRMGQREQRPEKRTQDMSRRMQSDTSLSYSKRLIRGGAVRLTPGD